jgi:glutaredoxin
MDAWRFLAWLGISPPPRLDHLHFVLYTRAGCHLCEDAWQCLEHEQRRYGFRMDVVNVDTDPELARRHGTQVPVVTVNGKERFRGTVNRVLLNRLFRAEMGSRRPRGR